MRSRLLVPVVALALTGAIASCDSDNDITDVTEGFDDAATWRASLSAAQEVPAPSVAGVTPSGRAWIVDNGTTLTYYYEYSGLSSNANNAHIHRAAAGVAGPVIVPITFYPATSRVIAGTVDMTLADVAPSAGETVSPDSLRTLLNNGNAYVNVHTVNNPAGEIRGQVARQ